MNRTKEMTRRKSRFTLREQIRRRVRIGFLSALGYVLRRCGQFQPYPLLPFLQLEVSDAVVRVTYSLYGFFASAFVAILKTVLTRVTFGPVGTPIPIGNRTAVFTSLRYSLRLLLCDKVRHLFTKKFSSRVVGYLIVILGVSSRMTFLNWWFITPTYRTFGTQWLDYGRIKDSINNLSSQVGQTFQQFFGKFNRGYSLSIFLAYFPFNLRKGILVCIAYEAICNRVIFHVLKGKKRKTNRFRKASEVQDKDNDVEEQNEKTQPNQEE